MPLTFIGLWDTTRVGVSFNGSAIASAADTTTPVGMQSSFDVANRDSIVVTGKTVAGDVLWAATGSGTLTNADAATINAFGNGDPNPRQFPGHITGFWDGRTGSFQRIR